MKPFYGANRPGAEVSQGTLDQFWLWDMQAGLKNAYESIKAFSYVARRHRHALYCCAG